MNALNQTSAAAVVLTYEGTEARQHATRLAEMLSPAGVAPAIEDETPAGGELGIGTLIVTFIASKLASSVAHAAVARVRAFLKERLDANDRELRLRVDVAGQTTKRLAFSLEQATLEAADMFCEQVDKTIDTLLP